MMLALASDQLLVPGSFAPQSLPATTPGCDPELARKRGTLFSRVATGVFNAERAIAAGPTVVKTNARAFMQLAADSRELGKVEGLIEACQPTALKVPQLQAALANNQRDLILLEARLNQAWLDKNYVQWMAMRASVQKFHRFVARNKVWLARAQAAQGTITPLVAVPIGPTFTTNDDGTAEDTTPPPPIVETPPDGMETIVEPKPPVYKRPAFWGGVAAAVVAAAGAVLLART